jgi:beta-mannosidase
MNKFMELTHWVVYWSETVENLENFLKYKEKMPNIPCKVPDQFYNYLYKADIEPNPYFGSNYTQYLKYERTHLWFETQISFDSTIFSNDNDASDQKLNLVFEGIDTYSEIYLNGLQIGTTNNMHIKWSFNLARLPNLQINSLIVHILPVPFDSFPRTKDVNRPVKGWNTRKAQHMFGWDIFPRLLSGGIYRPVYIEQTNCITIENVWIETQNIASNGAEMQLGVVIASESMKYVQNQILNQSNSDNLISFQLEVSPPENKVPLKHKSILFNSPLIFNSTTNLGVFKFTIPNPELWFPKPISDGSDPPKLYVARISFFKNGQQFNQKVFHFGIRLISIDQTPRPDKGQQFRFVVNGVPIFILGTNWVPLDALHIIPEGRIQNAFKMAIELNCNMIRIWGGGGYPLENNEEFYRLCDENGILVWQDFMMACGHYPTTHDFLASIKNEIPNVVHRIRNHPSIAIFCGDNENERDLIGGLGFKGDFNDFNPIGRQIIPNILEEILCNIQYIPSSPYNPKDWQDPDNSIYGDSHHWHHGKSFQFKAYFQDISSFISEIGHLSLPNVSTLPLMLPEIALNVPWKEWKEWGIHFGDVPAVLDIRDRFGKLMESMQIYFRMVRQNMIKKIPLDKIVFLSQCLHGEAHKYWIEMCRVYQNYCGGIIWWNLIDGWPQCSDAVVDYFLEKKVSYYITMQSQQPILPIILPNHEIWVVNNSKKSIQGSLLIMKLQFSTNQIVTLNDKTYDFINIDPNQSRSIGVVRSQPETIAYILKFICDELKSQQQPSFNYEIFPGKHFNPNLYLAFYEKIAEICRLPKLKGKN